MSNYTNWLNHSGLGNSQTEDIGKIAGNPGKNLYKFYCTSNKCAGRDTYLQKYKFTSRDSTIQMCVDCGHALFSKKVK